MATATMERLAKKVAQKPLMRFRLLAGGYDRIDPAFKELGTISLRELVLEKRGVANLDAVDAEHERTSVSAMTKPALLKEIGAYQRFRADAAKGTQPIIESDENLEKKLGRMRARVEDDDRRPQPERVIEKRVAVDFNEMTLDELRSFAAEEEIELPKDADNKAKVLDTIRAARRAK